MIGITTGTRSQPRNSSAGILRYPPTSSAQLFDRSSRSDPRVCLYAPYYMSLSVDTAVRSVATAAATSIDRTKRSKIVRVGRQLDRSSCCLCGCCFISIGLCPMNYRPSSSSWFEYMKEGVIFKFQNSKIHACW